MSDQTLPERWHEESKDYDPTWNEEEHQKRKALTAQLRKEHEEKYKHLRPDK